MKKAPILIGATAVGFVAVMTFHPKTAGTGLSVLPAPSTSGSTSSAGKGSASSTTTPSSAAAGSSAGSSPGSSTTAPTTATRTFTGSQANYNFGVLAVRITVSGHKITNVGLASITDGGNFRSQSIDQQAVPLLEQQAMAAQSANIQGVSGASYTSSGFQQSLQSALSQAGI